MRRASLHSTAFLAIALAACDGEVPVSPPDVTPSVGELAASGFITGRPAMAELEEGVSGSIIPLASVGDVLPGSGRQLVGLPDGIGAFGERHLEFYLNHEISGASRVSRFVVDPGELTILYHNYTLDGSEGYSRLCSASWNDRDDGFQRGYLFTGEETSDGLQLAIDARGRVTELPWIGAYAHENQVAVPNFRGYTVVINLDDSGTSGSSPDPDPDTGGSSELYMYVGRTYQDVLRGRGQLYAFASDEAPNVAGLDEGRTIRGHWVPIPDDVARDAPALESYVDEPGHAAFSFTRLEDGFYDKQRRGPRDRPVLWFFDTGDPDLTSPDGGMWDEWGSIYRMEWTDRNDPTGATLLTLVARSNGPASGWASPDNGDMNAEGVIMLQEDPAAGGWEAVGGERPPAIFALRVGREGHVVDPPRKVARVTGGDCSDSGPGNCWETSGIVDASEWLGRGAWIFDVQAHGEDVPDCPDCVEDGQVLVLRIDN